MNKMRCFIAVELPKEAVNEIAKIQQQLPKDSKFILVKPEIAHLTIKFFREINDFQAEKIKEVMEKISFPKFKAKINSVGVFTPKFIKVVWLEIIPKENFMKIHSIIDRMLSLEGFDEDKSFESHATIARVRFVNDKKEFIENLNKINIESKEFIIDKITLKKSTLTENGPIYDDIFKINLQ